MFKKNQRHLQPALISNVNDLPEKLRKRLERSWAGVFYREFFSRLKEAPFAVLYSDLPSRPNIPVNVLVGLETLKSGFGWSDGELYDAFCYDVQVRYALGYHQLGQGDFELRSLYNFRQRLSRYHQAQGVNLLTQAFEDITDQQILAFKVRTSMQRMDSTQVASNILDSSRLQLALEAIRRTYHTLSEDDQAHYAELLAAYIDGPDEQFLYRIKGKAETQQFLQQMGVVIHRLLNELRSQYASEPFFCVLERFFDENFRTESAGVLPKDSQELSSGSLQSLDDLEASYRQKGNKFYKGYVANASETCHPDNPLQLITQVQVAPNNTEDANLLIEALPNLKARTQVETLYTDAGYGSPDADEALIAEKVEQVQTGLRGNAPDPNKFNLADFVIQHSEEGRPLTITCPHGQTVAVEAGRTTGYLARFEPQICAGCPFQLEQRCRARPQKRNPGYMISFTQKEVNWARRRRRHLKHKQEGKNLRVAIEATMRVIKRPFPKGKLPVRGLFRMSDLLVSSAAMANVRSILRYLQKKEEDLRSKKRVLDGQGCV